MGSVSTGGTSSIASPECSSSATQDYHLESNLKPLNENGKSATEFTLEKVENCPSASTLIAQSDETKRLSQEGKNIMLEEIKSKEKDPCAICLGPINDETELDSCTHTFCFICTCEWLKNSGKCPLCKAPVIQIKHSLHKKLQQVVLLSTLQAEAEAARLIARGSSQPPHDEITCIQLRIRRIQKKISHIQHMMNRNKAKYSRSSDLARLNEQAVDELNRLDLLKREAASMTRGELLGNLAFRRIIYEDNLDWSPIDRNAIRVPFTPANCLASENESRTRLIPFIKRELMIVWLTRCSNGKDVLWTSRRKRLAWDIISTCLNHQINSPAFAKIMRGFNIDPRYIDRFQRELFDFASSRLSMEDFDKSSSYSSADLRERQSRIQHNPSNSNDIVFLHDDSNIESSQDIDSNDLVVLDEVDSLDERQRQGESNFDEVISSGSEAEREFYARPACRIDVADAFGYEFRVGLLNGFMSDTGGSSSRLYSDVQSSQLPLSKVSKTSKRGVNAARSTVSDFSNLRSRPHTTDTNVVYLSSDDEDFDVRTVSKALSKYGKTPHTQQRNQYMQYINSSDQKWNQSVVIMGDEQPSSNNDTIVIDDEPNWLNPYPLSKSNVKPLEKTLVHSDIEGVENSNSYKSDEQGQHLEHEFYDHGSDKGTQKNEINWRSESSGEVNMSGNKTTEVDTEDVKVEEQLKNEIGGPQPIVSEDLTSGEKCVSNSGGQTVHDKPLTKKRKKMKKMSSNSAKKIIEDKIRRRPTLQNLQKWSKWFSKMKEKCEEMMKTLSESSGEDKQQIGDGDGDGSEDHPYTKNTCAYNCDRKRKQISNRSTRSYSYSPISKRNRSSSLQRSRYSYYNSELNYKNEN